MDQNRKSSLESTRGLALAQRFAHYTPLALCAAMVGKIDTVFVCVFRCTFHTKWASHSFGKHDCGHDFEAQAGEHGQTPVQVGISTVCNAHDFEAGYDPHPPCSALRAPFSPLPVGRQNRLRGLFSSASAESGLPSSGRTRVR